MPELGVTKQATEFISPEAHVIRETHKHMWKCKSDKFCEGEFMGLPILGEFTPIGTVWKIV